MFGKVVWMGIVTGVLAVGCNDSQDRVGDAAGPNKCELGPEIYDDDSPSVASTVPCGWLGNLSATPGFALDVGHQTDIQLLSRTATRLLSNDGSRWVLWDIEARRMLKVGRRAAQPPRREFDPPSPIPPPPVLSDTRLAALLSTDGLTYDLEIASAFDGEVVATITMAGLGASSQFGFASDDSYLWATTKAGVSAWSTDGHLLAEASGNYEDARISAVPGELRIALPTRDVIETISTVTGDSTLSPAFQGDFHSWFVEGTRFLTTTSNTVRVYSGATVTQENIFTVATLRNLTGQGDHVSTYDDSQHTLDIYALSAPAAPAASYNYKVFDKAFPGGNRIGVLKYGVPSIDIIALGPTITRSSLDVPGYYNDVFTADDGGNWALGGTDGELFDSTDLTHPLSCGSVLSIARAEDGTTAVATAAGGIHLFKLTADSRQYLSTIPFPSGHVELSRDGLVLAASAYLQLAQHQEDRSLRVFSLPSGNEIKTWPYSRSEPSSGDALFFGFSMSSQGNRFGHETGVFDNSSFDWTYTRQVRDVDDNVSLALTESATDLHPGYDGHLRLSADGTLVAVAPFDPNSPIRRGDSTSVYENGVLINTFRGKPLAWFDDNRLLIGLDGVWRVADRSGHLEPAPKLPADYVYDPSERYGDAQIVSASEVYSPDQGAIYSLTTGEKLWTCGEPWSLSGPGAAAANYVVFVSGNALNKVVFDSY